MASRTGWNSFAGRSLETPDLNRCQSCKKQLRDGDVSRFQQLTAQSRAPPDPAHGPVAQSLEAAQRFATVRQ